MPVDVPRAQRAADYLLSFAVLHEASDATRPRGHPRRDDTLAGIPRIPASEGRLCPLRARQTRLQGSERGLVVCP